jgi:PIN domain nuclease of toxin-antitoxin system
MKWLLDTHLLLWCATSPEKLSSRARKLLLDPASALHFSVASLWEVAIKQSLGRGDFDVDASVLRRGLLDNGYTELPVTGPHVIAVTGLPTLHKDPFDRILIAQAQVEGIILLTADAMVTQYPGPIRRV